jgi:hypothetical protein
MPRPRNPIGELGSIQFTTLADGRVRGRARIRDDSGELRRVSKSGATSEEVIASLHFAAGEISTGGEETLSTQSTIQEACAVWLLEVRVSGRLTISTLESYEDTVRNIIVPACGGITLADLSVGRCNRIIQRLLSTRSISAARKARSVLSLDCGTAVRHDVLRTNPIRDVQRLPTSSKKESYRDANQIAVVRALMHRWRLGTTGYGPRPDSLKLEDGMDIMIGTCARLGEILALRPTDVAITTDPPSLLIAGTLVTTRQEGMTRKSAPKRTRQIRQIALPSSAADAALPSPHPVKRRTCSRPEPAGPTASAISSDFCDHSSPTPGSLCRRRGFRWTSSAATSFDAPRQLSSSKLPASRSPPDSLVTPMRRSPGPVMPAPRNRSIR